MERSVPAVSATVVRQPAGLTLLAGQDATFSVEANGSGLVTYQWRTNAVSVRGAVLSIPTGQWESAASLAFNRRQTLWRIILPQCVKRMLPPWMNLYAILTTSSPLISIVGVQDGMTQTRAALTATNRPDLMLPFYLFLLLLFFLYCYPIARATRALEAKFAVKG